jgi:vesicle-fusing ATPase
MQRRLSIRPKDSKIMARTFVIANAPSQDEALMNFVYVNPCDARAAYVTLGENGYVYRCCPHAGVDSGRIALNAVQRRHITKFAGDPVTVEDFLVPMRDFQIKACTLHTEWLKTGPSAPGDLTAIANNFRNQFSGHVLAKGQKVILKYGGELLLFTVRSEVKGLVTMQTELGVEFFSPDVNVV